MHFFSNPQCLLPILLENLRYQVRKNPARRAFYVIGTFNEISYYTKKGHLTLRYLPFFLYQLFYHQRLHLLCLQRRLYISLFNNTPIRLLISSCPLGGGGGIPGPGGGGGGIPGPGGGFIPPQYCSTSTLFSSPATLR